MAGIDTVTPKACRAAHMLTRSPTQYSSAQASSHCPSGVCMYSLTPAAAETPTARARRSRDPSSACVKRALRRGWMNQRASAITAAKPASQLAAMAMGTAGSSRPASAPSHPRTPNTK